MPPLSVNTVAGGVRFVNTVGLEEEAPKYLQSIGVEVPAGTFPLLGIMKEGGNIVTASREIKWWDEGHPFQTADVNSLYDDKGLGTPYTAAADAVGTPIYVKITDMDQFHEFRENHEVLLFVEGQERTDVVGFVFDKTDAGTFGILGIRLKQVAPYNAGGAPEGYSILSADKISVIGNRSPEFGGVPDGTLYNPTLYANYTGISITPVKVSGSAQSQEMRTGSALERARDRAFLLHGQELEMSALYGVRDNTSRGANGEDMWSPGGYISATKEYGGIRDDYKYSTSYGATGRTWANGGLDWLLGHLTEIGRFQGQYMCVCGYLVMRALQQLVENNSQYGVTGKETKFGTVVTIMALPGLELSFFVHPLWQRDATRARQAFIFDPANISMATKTGRDTHHIKTAEELKDKIGANAGWADGVIEVILTEYSWVYRFPNHFALLSGLGEDNLMS